MNVLYDPFPDSVEVKGQHCRIVTDFREWIRLLELVKDGTVKPGQKAELLMQWYLDKPPDKEEALGALAGFLRADGLYPHEENSIAVQGEGKEQEPSFSYTEDADCIFCAFMECYRIDLEQIPYMHWWKFRVLFDGLNEETEMKQRIRYRQMDISTIKDKEERKRVKKIKRAIALREGKHPIDDYEIGDVFG